MMEEGWKFLHVGLIVADTLKTLEFYKSLGFEVMREPYQTPAKSADNPRTSLISFVRKGDVVMEIIQPLEGSFVNKDFLAASGGGINHMAFEVKDLALERAKMEAAGYPVVYGGLPGGFFAYFDTRSASGNLIIELIQPELR